MEAGSEAARLVYRHNRVTRSTHWLNALALLILFMSGLQIFNAHPHLYWGHTSEPGTAFFSIGATHDDGELRGYVELYKRQIDTTGYLGAQQDALMPYARAFPSWMTIPGYYSLAAARRWHFFFGWLFALNGLLYVIYNLAAGHLRKFFFTWTDAKRIPAMIGYYLHLKSESPQTGEYNPLQKMAYTLVLATLAPLVLLSGLAMSPQLNVAFHWLPAMFGGRQSARAVHFILAFGFLGFTFGHVLMVLTQGFFNNMRSMMTGWYKEKIPLVGAPRRAVQEIRPDIGKALKTPDPPAAEVIDLLTVATAPGDLSDQSQPELPFEKAAAAPAPKEPEREKDAETKS